MVPDEPARGAGHELRDALDDAGLLPDAASYALVRAAALARGAACERALLARAVDAPTWARALEALGGDAVRDQYRAVMGYGELMARFLVAPLPLAPPARREVARLGAIANLLVGAFDELVDAGARRDQLLPAWPLHRAARGGRHWPLAVAARLAPAGPARLVRLLAREWFAGVAALSDPRAPAARRALLGRVVLEMYDADGRSPAEWARHPDAARARRKTEHPLVVLGYPAWLVLPGHEAAHRWHRAWLRRVGRYVRWVDDAADAPMDAASGQCNLALRATAGRPSSASGRRLARALVARHAALMAAWHDAGGAASGEPPEVTGVLGAVARAWLGAPAIARLEERT